MARPKHTDPELFTVGEIAHAAELTPRNMQLLGDSGLTPEAEKQADGKAGAALHDINALMHFAMVSAFHKAGLPLLSAGRICLLVPEQFNDARLAYMAGFGRQRLEGLEEWGSVAPEAPDAGFWMHHWLRRTRAAEYVPGRSWENDIVMCVADLRYAFIGRHHELGVRGNFGGLMISPGPEPVCEIEKSAARGLRAIPIYQRREWETEPGKLAVLNEYRDALAHAVGISRVNLSLSIRNALDRIHDLRMTKGGRLLPK